MNTWCLSNLSPFEVIPPPSMIRLSLSNARPMACKDGSLAAGAKGLSSCSNSHTWRQQQQCDA